MDATTSSDQSKFEKQNISVPGAATPEWLWDVLNGLQRVVPPGVFLLPRLPREDQRYVLRVGRAGGWAASSAAAAPPEPWLVDAMEGRAQRRPPGQYLPSLPDERWVYSVVVEKLPELSPDTDLADQSGSSSLRQPQ